MKREIFMAIVVVSSLSYADLDSMLVKAGMKVVGNIAEKSLDKDKGEVEIKNGSTIKSDIKLENKSISVGNLGVKIKGGKKIVIDNSEIDNKVVIDNSANFGNAGIEVGK